MEFNVQTCSAQSVRKTVPLGSTVALTCPSNDDNHIFKFWEFGHNNIIGPGNIYDESKYKYEVLSGKLYIKNVLPNESGCYNCYSEHINGTGHNVQSVHMLIKGSTHQALTQLSNSPISIINTDYDQQHIESTWDVVKLAAIIISLVVIIGCAILYWRLRGEWSKYDGRIVVPIDDDDEEEGDEIYNRTTTSINPVAGPSRNASSDQLYGIDNHGLDTDFNSVFQQIQIKSPQQSLI